MKCDYCKKSATFPYKSVAPIETPEENVSWESFHLLSENFGIHFCPIDYCENSKSKITLTKAKIKLIRIKGLAVV